MAQDFLGKIGGLNFVTGKVAWEKARKAQLEGRFGKPHPNKKNKKNENNL